MKRTIHLSEEQYNNRIKKYRPKVKKKDNRFIEAFVATLIIGGIFLFFLWGTSYWAEQKGYQDGFTNGTSFGINQTLSNNTLMSEVVNNVNIYYIKQFNAIPIYFNGQLYSCSNITVVGK